MSKSKHSNKIVEDHDGTFYCLKCGQAGFKTKSAGYGHLTTCKGYKSAVNKITKELKELGLNPASSKIETNQLDEAVNMNADSNRSLSAHISHEALESGPPVGHPRATLRVTLFSTRQNQNRINETENAKRSFAKNRVQSQSALSTRQTTKFFRPSGHGE